MLDALAFGVRHTKVYLEHPIRTPRAVTKRPYVTRRDDNGLGADIRRKKKHICNQGQLF